MTAEELRPFADAEVAEVVERLLTDDALPGFLADFESPRLNALAPSLMRYLTRRRLRGILGSVRTIRDFQQIVEGYVQRLVDTTMTEFVADGVERVSDSRPHVFVSNHRDIAGDSMLLNFALHRAGLDTVRIAVGDNLVQMPFATDLMKLNKSFFIKRSGETRRQVYESLLETSRYINDSVASGHSVWIAQAGGRAKDGIDRTDPAVIKMLTLAAGKRGFNDALAGLSIVPVSLSYEIDPCDSLKAAELASRAKGGDYVKKPGEDLLSLARGLTGKKGRVHLCIGDDIGAGHESPEAVALCLDRAIMGRLQLFPVNYDAARRVAAMDPGSDFATLDLPPASDSPLDERLAGCAHDAAPYLLRMYANPVLQRHRLGLPIVQ